MNLDSRDARNLRLALLAEWATGISFGVLMGDLPPSTRRGDYRDGGYDLVTSNGLRIDVKASGPEFPELMIPWAHEAKFARASSPVDAFVKATVDEAPLACLVTLTCWEYRTEFLVRAHRSRDRYPIPTLWMLPSEVHELGRVVDVPVRVVHAVEEYLERRGGAVGEWLRL